MKRRKLAGTAPLVIAWLWLLTSLGSAEPVEPGDAVAGHSGLTYFDLMKMVVTDLPPPGTQGEATAHQIVPYRHIEGESAKTAPGGPVSIKILEPLEIHADGKSRLALIADLGESDGAVAEFVLLALFDLTDKPKLLDVVEVGNDRMTGFTDKPLRPLGHGSDLIQIESEHFDASVDFYSIELLFVRNSRFQLVDSVFNFSYSTCTYQLTESPSIRTSADPGTPYNRILVAVRETVALQAERDGCGEKTPHPFARTFRATYRWDARRSAFATTSIDLKQLDKVNSKLNSDDPGLR